MKTNEQFHGSATPAGVLSVVCRLPRPVCEAYAEHGLPDPHPTPQNEPMYATSNYPTMGMTAQAQQTFVRDHLGPALKAAGILHPPVDFRSQLGFVGIPARSARRSRRGRVRGWGGVPLLRGGDVNNQSLVHNAYPEKGIWFTECSGGEWATDFGGNMSWNMHNLVLGNFRNWGKGVILWNLALDENFGPQNGGCGDCRGVVKINQSTGEVTYNEEYYILGHISKFVDPGVYRADLRRTNLPPCPTTPLS